MLAAGQPKKCELITVTLCFSTYSIFLVFLFGFLSVDFENLLANFY